MATWKKLLGPAVEWATDDGLLSKTRTGRILKKFGRNVAETVGILETAPPAYAAPGSNQAHQGAAATRAPLRRRADEDAARPISFGTGLNPDSRATTGDGAHTAQQPPIRARVRLYTKRNQPTCRAAREFLEQLGIPFEEHDVSQDTDAKSGLKSLTGDTQVPKILINSTCVRSFEELADLQANGKLEGLLAEAPDAGT